MLEQTIQQLCAGEFSMNLNTLKKTTTMIGIVEYHEDSHIIAHIDDYEYDFDWDDFENWLDDKVYETPVHTWGADELIEIKPDWENADKHERICLLEDFIMENRNLGKLYCPFGCGTEINTDLMFCPKCDDHV